MMSMYRTPAASMALRLIWIGLGRREILLREPDFNTEDAEGTEEDTSPCTLSPSRRGEHGGGVLRLSGFAIGDVRFTSLSALASTGVKVDGARIKVLGSDAGSGMLDADGSARRLPPGVKGREK